MRSLLALALCLLASTLHAAEPRPNILWLIAEDMGPALACYGQKHVHTPHLDALAAQGMRYTRFYTTAPVCSPSRSAFITGMYQTTIGAHQHRSHRDDGYQLPAGVKILPEWLRAAGYYNANVMQFPPEIAWKGVGKTDWNFTPPTQQFESKQWSDLATHQPFFAQINFQETHRKFKAPPHADPAQVELPPYYPDHPIARQDYAQYLDAATELDRKVGAVLELLKKDGLAENTIILFMGDNGEAHVRGKQFCYEEGLHVPFLLYVPPGLKAPAGYTPGRVEDRLVEAIDVAPTLLSFAGAAIPPAMQGRPFLGAQAAAPRECAFGARDRCDETSFRLRTVRDARYRYIRNFTPQQPLLAPNKYKENSYPMWNLLKQLGAEGKLTSAQARLTAPTMPEEELYDLQADPHELTNLAGDPAHAATQKRLRAALDRWIEETKDQGRTPEPPELIQAQGVTKPGTKPLTGYTMDGNAPGPANRPKATPKAP